MLKLNKTIISVMIVMMLVAITLTSSYAVMTDNLSASVSLEPIRATYGKMIPSYQGNSSTLGNGNVVASNEAVASKEFSIKGTNEYGDGLMHYNLRLEITYNNLENSDLYFVLGGTNMGREENDNKKDGIVPTADGNNKFYLDRTVNGTYSINLGTGYFDGNAKDEIHKYVIKFYYKEKANTNSHERKSFSTNIVFSA